MYAVPTGIIQQVAFFIHQRFGDIQIPDLLINADLHQRFVEFLYMRQRKPIGRTALLLQLSHRQYRLRVNISVRVALLDQIDQTAEVLPEGIRRKSHIIHAKDQVEPLALHLRN